MALPALLSRQTCRRVLYANRSERGPVVFDKSHRYCDLWCELLKAHGFNRHHGVRALEDDIQMWGSAGQTRMALFSIIQSKSIAPPMSRSRTRASHGLKMLPASADDEYAAPIFERNSPFAPPRNASLASRSSRPNRFCSSETAAGARSRAPAIATTQHVEIAQLNG
jgi:hypothetical protein